MQFRKHFDYDYEEASDASAVFPVGESLTVQSQADDADINVLMYRYGVTGKLPDNPRVPTYGDFTGVRDYQSALAAIMDADQAFMEFPAKVRARFDNDPQMLMDFISDRGNLEEARALGLIKEIPHGSRSGVAGDGAGSAGAGASAVGGVGGDPAKAAGAAGASAGASA